MNHQLVVQPDTPPQHARRGLVSVLALITVLLAQSGCGPAAGSATKITGAAAETSTQWSSDLFSFALENLNHLEDNDCREMLRSTRQRLEALQQPKAVPASVPFGKSGLPADFLLASWPEPDMLRQVVSRLNQWVDTQEKPGPWKPDPMLATLPPELAKLPMVQNLGDINFTAYDGYMLMEAVWLRDAARSKSAGGGSTDELLAARSLFDWTLRNIQNDDDGPGRVPQVPWETLFLGHGTTWERAWTYILLLRQRGIDAALLALPEEALPAEVSVKKPEKSSSATSRAEKGSLKPWCVGVLIGEKEKKLYLFDPQLGLPIPGPRGIAADKSGQLDVEPATLEQVVANPKLLEAMSLGAAAPYWAQNADLKRVVALVEASPIYLAPRAKRIESRLSGEQRMVLSAEPSRQAGHFKQAGLADVRLWELPYTTLNRRLALSSNAVIERLLAYEPFMNSLMDYPVAPLYKGRILHLKGKYFAEREAIACYQRARPRNSDVAADAPKRAQACYQELAARAKEHLGRDLTPQEDQNCRRAAEMLTKFELSSIVEGKLDGSYWLGLIQYDAREYDAALEYFDVRTLQFRQGVCPWATGAHYNIARALEAGGQRQKAIEEYESNILVRDVAGNPILRKELGSLLRARWLKELEPGKSKKLEERKAST